MLKQEYEKRKKEKKNTAAATRTKTFSFVCLLFAPPICSILARFLLFLPPPPLTYLRSMVPTTGFPSPSPQRHGPSFSSRKDLSPFSPRQLASNFAINSDECLIHAATNGMEGNGMEGSRSSSRDAAPSHPGTTVQHQLHATRLRL